MADHGYDGATTQIIAAEAGLTPGVIHYHFDSKQSILIELIDHLFQLLEERYHKLLKSNRPSDQLTAFINAHVAFGKGESKKAVLCWVAIGAEAVKQPEVKLAYQNATSKQLVKLETILKDLLKQSGRKSTKTKEIALAIVAAIDGTYRLQVSAPKHIVRGFAQATINDIALDLIRSRSQSKQK